MLTNMNMLRATMERDKAIIADANLQIEYSKIVAPFDGKLSESNVDIGDLVSPDFVRLVTINTSSPIYVNFSVPEKYLDRINKSQKSNDLALTVRTISDQEIKDGEIVFVDNSIDPNSGTIKVKATLPNQNEILWPGQCVPVSLTIYIEQEALIVPSKAMQTNEVLIYLLSIKIIKPWSIDIVFSNDDFIVIKSGIDEGATVAERLSMLPGVAQRQVYGSQQYAVRVQIDPVKMAANNIGLDQVSNIISSANVNLPTGALYGTDIYSSIRDPGQLQNVKEYNELILTYKNGNPLVLKNIGKAIDSVANNKIAA